MELILQLVVNGIVMGSIYALIAIGFALIFVTTRLFHFAHGAVYVVAAYAIYLMSQMMHQNLVIALLFAMAVAIGLGALMELAVYRPLRNRGATPLVILIASLGSMIFLQNFLAMLFGTDSKSLAGAVSTKSYSVGLVTIDSIQIITVLTAIVLFVGLQLYLRKTKTGKAIRAVANNPAMARIVGISSNRIYVLAFVVGSALVVPASLLVTLHTGITPSMGLLAIMMGAIAVIVGGVGSIPGAALGALLIGIAENVGVWQIPSEWQSSISFGILLIFIIFKPTGFFGQKMWKAEI